MPKFFRINSDVCIIFLPAEDEKEAETKTRQTEPSIRTIKDIREASDVEVAESEIGALQDQIYAMGANDYEMPAIQDILDSLRGGKIEPSEAVRQVRQIKDSKQDYH